MDAIVATPWLFITLLLALVVVAFLYSSVGHGGASGYLALLSLVGASQTIMRPSALLLNVFVSLISFVAYYRGGYFKWRLFLPFAILSVPAAFIGAGIHLDALIYKKVLGVCLLFPVLRLFGVFPGKLSATAPFKFWYGLVIGFTIGLLSGMIGIGGGIILSPVILLFHWADMKETAAASALFILVNSISGLGGLMMTQTAFDPNVYYLIGAAIIGGALGAYYGANKFNTKILTYILASVLLLAAVKLIFT